MAKDVEVSLGDFTLEHGGMLKNDLVQGRLYGPKGNVSGAPLVVVPGGISASRFVADGVDGKDGSGGWWSHMIYPGGPIDLNHVQVLGFDCAPNSNDSNNSDNTSEHLTITTADQAKRLGALLDHLNIERVHSIIGMSYGGMIALAFAQEFPQRVQNLCIFGAAHRPWPMGVALRGIQRRTIDLATKLGEPLEGLKLARELAMTTYRSAEEFSQRFSATPSGDVPATFDVGDYLIARGQHYKNIMPVNRFLALSESIDLHSVDPAKIHARTVLIAVKTDQLAPPSEMQALCDALAGPAELHVINSIYGHDSFLKATDLLAPILSGFIGGQSYAA